MKERKNGMKGYDDAETAKPIVVGRGTRHMGVAIGVVADALSSPSPLLQEHKPPNKSPCSPASEKLKEEGLSPRTLDATEPESALAAYAQHSLSLLDVTNGP